MSISEWGEPGVPSINTGIFFSFARSTIFAIGKTAPVTPHQGQRQAAPRG